MRFDPAGAGTVRKNRLESDGKRSKPAGLHNPIRCVDSSPEVIRLAVMLTFRYPLSLRQVEDILFERGIDILESVRAASDRVAALTGQLEQALPNWSLAPVVRSLVALRGVDKITAMTVLAEVGDLSRFDSPRQLMGYLGLVPSEHSSGARRRRAGITRTGNGHVRRALVESAWSYRFPAQRTAHLKRKAAEASAEAQAIAWRAPAALVRLLSDSAPGRQEYQAGECGRCPRVVGLRLGYRLPGDGPDRTGTAPGGDPKATPWQDAHR